MSSAIFGYWQNERFFQYLNLLDPIIVSYFIIQTINID